MTDDESTIHAVGPSALFKTKLNAYALTLVPAIVALIVVGGLAILSLENLGSGSGLRHMSEDHSQAILRLLFRN